MDDLLDETNLSKDRLILVPGNHDVDRGLISRGAKAIAKDIDSRDTINEILSNDKDRQLIMDKFTHFFDLMNESIDAPHPYDDKH